MSALLDASSIFHYLRPGTEVYAPGCGGHSLLFEAWLRQAPERCAQLRFTGVHIPTVNRFDLAGLHPQTRQRTISSAVTFAPRGWPAGSTTCR